MFDAPFDGPPFHFGIATTDVAAIAPALEALLGLTWVALPRTPVVHHTPNGPVKPSSRVMWSSDGPLHVELLLAEPGTIYRPELGTRLHHVGYWTDDLPRAIATCQEQGWQLEASMLDDQGAPSAFAYLARPGCIGIEISDSANRPWLETTLRNGG